VAGLLLRISADGGFVPPGFLVTRLPRISIYTDGRVIEPGAIPAIYPGPPVSPLTLRLLDGPALEAIRAAARTAGLDGPDRSWANAQVADVETTVLTYVDGNGTHTTSIYALGFEPGPGASDEEKVARQRAVTFTRTVDSIVAAAAGSATYQPEAYRIFALPVAAPVSPEPGLPSPNTLDWPAVLPSLAGLPTASRPPGARCGVIQGQQLATFNGLLATATQITRYREGSGEWTLLIRPLLPDEARSCP